MLNHNKESETKEERQADQCVIDRGLGQALLQFHHEHNKEHKSFKANEGLTKREIKNQLKNR